MASTIDKLKKEFEEIRKKHEKAGELSAKLRELYQNSVVILGDIEVDKDNPELLTSHGPIFVEANLGSVAEDDALGKEQLVKTMVGELMTKFTRNSSKQWQFLYDFYIEMAAHIAYMHPDKVEDELNVLQWLGKGSHDMDSLLDELKSHGFKNEEIMKIVDGKAKKEGTKLTRKSLNKAQTKAVLTILGLDKDKINDIIDGDNGDVKMEMIDLDREKEWTKTQKKELARLLGLSPDTFNKLGEDSKEDEQSDK